MLENIPQVAAPGREMAHHSLRAGLDWMDGNGQSV